MTPPWRQWALLSAGAVLAVVVGALAEAAVGTAALDRLTPRNAPVDTRVVVVTFGRGLGSSSIEVPHLRATSYRDIAVLSARGGARAVAFVDFDSLTFSDGGLGRSNVIGSEDLQQLGVAPLLDVSLVGGDGRIPFLPGYRVDTLASELTGLGVGSFGDSARTVPGLVRVDGLSDGLIVDTPPFAYDTIDEGSTTIVPGLSLRLAELGTGDPLTEPSADSVLLGDVEVPLENGRLRIAWSDEIDEIDDVRVVASGDLFTDPPDDLFQDAIVLVGTIDPSRTAYIDTPVGALPEVLVQANAVNTVLQAEWVRPGPAVTGWIALMAGVAGLLVTAGITAPRRRLWFAMTVAVVGAALWFGIATVLARGGTLVPVVMPIAGLATGAAALGVMRQFEATVERRRIRSLFAEYVPASVAEQLIASGRGDQASAGERVALTALFCDLRDFTSIAARLQPPQVRELLNQYYDRLGQVVFDHGGTVLQYTGDEIFAVFGAPLPDPDHPTKALTCARVMFDVQQGLNDELLVRGLPPVNYGIGLHSGDAVAAHVGSSVRMQYAVIGDTINLASRHCSLAREGQIALSDATLALVGDLADAELVDHADLKGLAGDRPVHVIQQGPTAMSGSPALVNIDPQMKESS